MNTSLRKSQENQQEGGHRGEGVPPAMGSCAGAVPSSRGVMWSPRACPQASPPPAHLDRPTRIRCESGEQTGCGWLSPLLILRKKPLPCICEAEMGKGKVKWGTRGVSRGVRSPTALELDRPHRIPDGVGISVTRCSVCLRARFSPVHRDPFLRVWSLPQRQVCEASVWGASPASGAPSRPCRGQPRVSRRTHMAMWPHGSDRASAAPCRLWVAPPSGRDPSSLQHLNAAPRLRGASSPPHAGGVPPHSASRHARAAGLTGPDTLQTRVCDRPRGQRFGPVLMSVRLSLSIGPSTLTLCLGFPICELAR